MLRTLLSKHILGSSKKLIFKNAPASISSRFYSNGSNIVEQWISELDEAKQKRIKFIRNEITLKRDQEQSVPTLDYLTVDHYQQILNLSNNQRVKYYNYLCKMEQSESFVETKDNLRKQVTEAKIAMGELKNKTENQRLVIEYGLGKNAMLPKVYPRTIDKIRNLRTLWWDIIGAPKLVYDCSYSQHMTARENHEAVKQLVRAFSINRKHLTPYSLQFCGMQNESLMSKFLHKQIPTLITKRLPLWVHEKDVTEMFPKEKLVILTPNSPNILKEYNNDDIYVVSAIVDRGDKQPLSIAKAKLLDIRHARLPLEQYRKCKQNKALTLNVMMEIMLELKKSRDWDKAFQYIGARKFY